MNIITISFDTCAEIWKEFLWPGRGSAIETHSAWTWPFEGDPESVDMSIFNLPAIYHACEVDGKIAGVNSAHGTSPWQVRSRGLWVDPAYRGQGFAQALFDAQRDWARAQGAEMIWSIPRMSSLPSYVRAGFQPVGDPFGTETSELNVYASQRL